MIVYCTTTLSAMNLLQSWAEHYRDMVRLGARQSSLFSFPIRRRIFGEQSLRFDNGISLTMPEGEPFFEIVDEVWEKECYRCDDFSGKMPEGHIVDIGAHMGTFTLWAAMKWPERGVIAVEPSATSYKYLQRNVRESHAANVSVVNSACGEKSGRMQMYARGNSAMNSLFTHDNYGSMFEPMADVEMTTLEKLFADHHVEQCAFLKMDCEGAEYAIITAAPDATLKKCSRIAMEYHLGMNGGKPEQIIARLEPLGFIVKVLPPSDEEGGYLYAYQSDMEKAKS